MTSEGGMSPADYAAINGNNNGFGYGGFSEWIIVLFLFAMFGGWGNGFGGNGGGGNNLYPWLNNSNQINDGFRDQMLNDNITSIRDGVYGLGPQLCNGFNGVTAAVTNGFAQAEIANNSRQMADMQQMFGLSQQLSQCCCDNRLATCQTQNMVQNEGNATRFADANNTRDLLTNQTANTQAILDKLCQLELDGYKRENDSLRTQLTAANFRESQTAQNALISQGFANEVDQLYNRLSNCPVPSTPVYGRTPIFTCNQNNGCGCGM